MRVTVLIPLYNQAHFLMAAVASVRAQSHTDWELLVVDDGSTDGGACQLASLEDDRIRVIRQDNAGVSVARNSGLAEARTSWVALLDADDTWGPSHLSDLLDLAVRHPEALILGTGFWYVDRQGNRLRRSARIAQSSENALAEVVISDYCQVVQRYGMPFVTSSVMINRAATLSLGGFKPGVKAGEDLLMWATLAHHGAVVCSDECSTFYLEPPMAPPDRVQAIRRPQEPDVVGQALESLGELPDGLAGLRAFRANWYRMRAVLWLELNERSRCLSELRLAVECDGVAWKDVGCLMALALPYWVRLRLVALKRQRVGSWA
jgi:hypothetical protein